MPRSYPQAQATSADASERYTNTWIAFRSIYKTEGWRAFYKGLAPSLIGVTHVAVHFPLYEKMKAWAGELGPCTSSYQLRLKVVRSNSTGGWRTFEFPKYSDLLSIVQDGCIRDHLSPRGITNSVANTAKRASRSRRTESAEAVRIRRPSGVCVDTGQSGPS